MSEKQKPKAAAEGANQRYVDPNSGAAPQPGGFAAAPVVDDSFDAAVADDITEEQEAARQTRKETGSQDAEQDRKADRIRKAASKLRVQDDSRKSDSKSDDKQSDK